MSPTLSNPMHGTTTSALDQLLPQVDTVTNCKVEVFKRQRLNDELCARTHRYKTVTSLLPGHRSLFG